MTHPTSRRVSPASVLARTATAASDHAPAARGRSLAETRRRPRRIGLLGLFGCGNAGNDGSLEAMLAFLNRLADFIFVLARWVDRESEASTFKGQP